MLPVMIGVAGALFIAALGLRKKRQTARETEKRERRTRLLLATLGVNEE